MNQIHYIISDAAKALHVEPHVLRYWEDELNLKIPRNKMGHRIYGEKEIDIFRQIMKWKEEGLALKEIQKKCILANATLFTGSSDTSEPEYSMAGNPGGVFPVGTSHTGTSQIIQYPQEHTAPADDDKMQQFKQILGRIVSDAIRDNSVELTTDIASHVSDHVNKELDFLFREKEEADERRFRNLDETMRNIMKARQEAAAAEIPASKAKKRRKFGKK